MAQKEGWDEGYILFTLLLTDEKCNFIR